MNILLMSWFFPPTIGGIPSLLDTLLKTWQGNEMNFFVLTKEYASGYQNCVKLESLAYITLRLLTQTYEPIPYKTWDELNRVIDLQIELLSEEISNYAIDVIFAHTDLIIADRLSKLTGIPCLFVQHGLMPHRTSLQKTGNKVVEHYDWIKEATVHVVADMSFVSGYNRDQWYEMGMRPKKDRIIYNPINFDMLTYNSEKRQMFREKYEIPEEAIVLLYAQRTSKLWFNEGIEVVLEALRKNPSVYLIICDNYPIKLVDADIKPRILSHKFAYKEMAAVYSASDLTLLIAHDTFGLPIIESLACGTPVLCNDSCSFNELLCLEQWEGTVERAYFYITLEDLDKQLQSFINREKRIHPQDLLSIKEKKLFSSHRIARQYYDILYDKCFARSRNSAHGNQGGAKL